MKTLRIYSHHTHMITAKSKESDKHRKTPKMRLTRQSVV